ncbi:MAG: alpha/beta hydrolase [Candidatus Heimdallarchaeota archaeon]|nr:alpha/beta hydrolase [Candidatus Heimdallarchaeota archaeon]MCK4769910.1 alpha/beta hydrolase [Candidatus Heimdallarchaeota archaeon]
MKEEIQYITTNQDPEIKIRVAKFSSKKEEYSSREIVLIPGWLSGIDNYSPLAKALTNYGNVSIYEPRGFGKSITPHKKGLFTPKEYSKELAVVLESLEMEDRNFTIFGGCSGGFQAMDYYLNSKGPKPNALALISPEEKIKIPFWLPVLGWIPSFIMGFIQKLIIVFYGLYLKIRRTKESQNVNWATERMKVNDNWCMRRYVLEFTILYDIRDRQKEIDVPLIMFVGEEDYFVDPDVSKKFLHNPDSEIITLKTTQHRIQKGNEEEIANKTNEFLEKIEI